MPTVRVPGRPAGHRDPAAGARAVWVAPDHADGHRPPLPVRRLRARVARGHGRRGGAAGEDLPNRPALGSGRHRPPAPVDGARRRGAGVCWNSANDAVLAEGQRLLIDHPARLDGVRVVGVDQHVWRHTRKGDKYVTVVIDLTLVRDGTGPSRLLDVVDGRSKKAFKGWLADRDQALRRGIEVVAVDAFSGFMTATTEELPDAVSVMDPFHVVRLACEALNECRRRVQQELHGHRGRKGDPLYSARRTLHRRRPAHRPPAGAPRRAVRERAACGGRGHLGHLPADGLRLPGRRPGAGRIEMRSVIDALTDGVPAPLVELRKLGRTLARRVCDVLAYFDRPRTSNGPTEAVNGRLEHLRGLAVGFRNLTHYIAKAILEAGRFRTQLHPGL
ncbi:ISL3 family transposase [uncultured Serinicoccus sp.]|uniref:ISL3 family transposase n=1 Tax=uncultured Serinicoccus sp. TaxID=735514 RepID=UPI00342E6BB8